MSAPLEWKRSDFCREDYCVEVAEEYGYVLVRNSRIPLEVIRFHPGEWKAFVEGIRHGGFDYSGPGETG